MRQTALVVLALALLAQAASAGDWLQWAGTDAKNMVSPETGLADSFVPGEKRPSAATITRNDASRAVGDLIG